MNEYQFFSPVDVVFGCGSLSKLHTLKMPGKKALLVISNGKSARMNGSLDRTIDELKQADVSYVLYNGIGANPLKSAVEEGARIGRENGVDFVVALGGGSVMDAAKNMAMFIPQPSDNLWDYANCQNIRLPIGIMTKNQTRHFFINNNMPINLEI